MMHSERHCAVDIGGTFTDLVYWDPEAKAVTVGKSLTTYSRPLDAVMDCVAQADVGIDELSLFKHGTTLVINTLLERSGARVALVATRGFKDVIEFGRGSRVGATDLRFRRAEPMVSPRLRFELNERVDARGSVIAEPRLAEVQELAEQIRLAGAEAVAISFMNSYRWPAHERQVADWLRAELPGMFVTCGSDLSQEWHEYERTATATANAYVGQKVVNHISDLSEELGSRGFAGQLLMMGSSGGVLAPLAVQQGPIRLVESGPVGGCIGAAAIGTRLGFDNVIAFDMGGTTAKCAIAKAGTFDVETTYYVGGYGTGTPVRVPVVDIVEVGAGGGSIAWVDPQGQLKVGPRSAGSAPGPAAYGLGGVEPTITDAHVFLGRLNPENFQGGAMPLDADAAKSALENLAKQLGYSENDVTRLAAGILSIAALTMSSAIRRVTVERGEDPRDFVMFAYGGAGPLQAVDLARELSIPTVIVPPVAGNFSALGMLLAEVRYDENRTFVRRLDDDGLSGAQDTFRGMCDDLRVSISQDFAGAGVRFELSAEARFEGQYHATRVMLSPEDGTTAAKDRFRSAYGTRFGHRSENSEIEFVSLRATAFVETALPELDRLGNDGVSADVTPTFTTRDVYFPAEGEFAAASVFAREALPIGFAALGPAVIEEHDCTTIIGAGDAFEVGELGEIRISLNLVGADQ